MAKYIGELVYIKDGIKHTKKSPTVPSESVAWMWARAYQDSVSGSADKILSCHVIIK